MMPYDYEGHIQVFLYSAQVHAGKNMNAAFRKMAIYIFVGSA